MHDRLISPSHDAAPGALSACQVCGSSDLRLIIDLGHQPLCDALLTVEQLNEPETTYPLRLMQCEVCSLAQLDYVVPASLVYPATYPYRAGISWPVVAAHKAMASDLVRRYGLGLVVDIGCNDGTLLACFQSEGCKTRGVEPTDIATYAPAVAQVVQDSFTERVARDILRLDGPAHLITFTNVFAHMADLGEVMRGVCALLARDGVLVIENHYLMDILEFNQFDSIYHEHVRTYTLKSLVTLFAHYDLEVIEVERVTRYGGNIRAHVARKGARAPARSVRQLLDLEDQVGLGTAGVWTSFRSRVDRARDIFMTYRNWNAVGCSAPGRASTLLNYFGVTTSMLPWTGELDGSLKIGKYLPGCHIPVVSNKRILQEKPEYVVLLAWHYAKEIRKRLRDEGVRAKLIVPLPEFAEFA